MNRKPHQSACKKDDKIAFTFGDHRRALVFIKISDATYLGLFRRLSGVRAPTFTASKKHPPMMKEMQILTHQSACKKDAKIAFTFGDHRRALVFIKISDATYLGLFRRLSGVRAPTFTASKKHPPMMKEMQTLTHQSACKKEDKIAFTFGDRQRPLVYIQISDAKYLGLFRRLSGVRAFQFMLNPPGPQGPSTATYLD